MVGDFHPAMVRIRRLDPTGFQSRQGGSHDLRLHHSRRFRYWRWGHSDISDFKLKYSSLSGIHTVAHVANAVNFSRYYNPYWPVINMAQYPGQHPLWMVFNSGFSIRFLPQSITKNLIATFYRSKSANIAIRDLKYVSWMHEIFP